MFRSILLIFALSLFTLTACAATQKNQDAAVATALSLRYPKLNVQQIVQAPVDGIYEITLDNNEIIYFAPASGHLFFGELWSPEGHNLTRESKDRRLSSKLDQLPLDKAIKIGDGPNQVIEVTDPDCPFCRQSSQFFAGRDDITRYIFLFPLDRIHPNAATKASYILSSEDPAGAYEDVFNGMYDKDPLPAFNDNGLLQIHRDIAAKIGITGTPKFWINGQHISGYNPKQFEALLTK